MDRRLTPGICWEPLSNSDQFSAGREDTSNQSGGLAQLVDLRFLQFDELPSSYRTRDEKRAEPHPFEPAHFDTLGFPQTPNLAIPSLHQGDVIPLLSYCATGVLKVRKAATQTIQ